MKYEDICKFKGDVKTAVQTWAEGKVDAIFKNRPQTRVLMKRALNNWLTMQDERMNKVIDAALLFVADEHGNVDSDAVVEMIVGLFNEMEKQEYDLFAGITASVGKGEFVVSLPRNPYMDLLVGNLGMVKITAEDILEFKELLV